MSVDPNEEELERIREVYKNRERTIARMRYSHFNPAFLFAMHRREECAIDLLRRRGITDLSSRKVLEVGCGGGYWLLKFIQWGVPAEGLTGVDLLPAEVELAKSRLPAAARLLCGDATRLDFQDESFDVVAQFTMFTSILDAEMRRAVAAEMLRVMKPDGVILWYDYFMDNPFNPDVRGVGRAELEALFPGCVIDRRRVTLAPPLAERIAPHSRLACELLERIPLLCTHYIATIRRGAAGS